MDLLLSREILDRVERLAEYHRASKHTYQSVRGVAPPVWKNKPGLYRSFDGFARIPLPTHLLDIAASALDVMNSGQDALPDSALAPPQDLKTLASWLHLSCGLTQKERNGNGTGWTRAVPSSGGLYPCEVYVAAFAIEGLEPGLYHYSPQDFALYQLRVGSDTLALIQRGRPDLRFLRSLPGALIVSTIFWRSAWKYQRRGYRHALHDAGHLIQNLVSVGTGLGIQTVTRLRIVDSSMRELIGISPEADFADAESVQGMVIWGDQARKPLELPAGGLRSVPVATIPRAALSPAAESYGTILAAHQDCVAPGVAIRVVRPPLTEMSPLPPNVEQRAMPLFDPVRGAPLRQVLLGTRGARKFSGKSISRHQFLTLNHVAMRGGSFFPIFPDGPYVGLVRPFWIVHDVPGVESGIWYYDPTLDRWSMLSRGRFRREAAYLALEQELAGDSAATCFLVSHLLALMTQGGPDTYRLAHLEAGIVGQRLYLAAGAQGLGFAGLGAFYDDEVRKFLGLENTGWEPIYCCCVGQTGENGVELPDTTASEANPPRGEEAGWRD